MPRRFALTVLAAAALAPWLHAHPDHSATKKDPGVTFVPSDQAAPGESRVSITTKGEQRVIVANGLPDHRTGRFPNRDNPNEIRAQTYRFTIPLHPQPAARVTKLVRQPFGIALNGVLFDPGTAEYWQNDRDSGWHYDALGGAFSLGLDADNAHVQPNGAYHYHGIPTALLARLSSGKKQMTLVGWAADGFPIYAQWDHRDPKDAKSEIVAMKSSYRLKSGTRPTSGGQPGGRYDGVFEEDFEFVAGSGDLDECGGRFGVTPEFPAGIYHYVLTTDFPFIPRAFRGTPDPSFARRNAGGPPRDRPARRRGN